MTGSHLLKLNAAAHADAATCRTPHSELSRPASARALQQATRCGTTKCTANQVCLDGACVCKPGKCLCPRGNERQCIDAQASCPAGFLTATTIDNQPCEGGGMGT